jgi:hypothetical protein
MKLFSKCACNSQIHNGQIFSHKLVQGFVFFKSDIPCLPYLLQYDDKSTKMTLRQLFLACLFWEEGDILVLFAENVKM